MSETLRTRSSNIAVAEGDVQFAAANVTFSIRLFVTFGDGLINPVVS